jgi:hypothetical protein
MIYDQDLIIRRALIELPDSHIFTDKKGYFSIAHPYTTLIAERAHQTIYASLATEGLIATEDNEMIGDAEDNPLCPYTDPTQ